MRLAAEVVMDAGAFDPVVFDLGGAEAVLARVERFRSALAA
ncbi:MAG: hypothetical protein Q7K37_05985 [Dehalococcoidia bacterium]|nr:hypothetical protein [Dehalococcoidia bacterium]